jgi:long-chain acyl-CoA synthetase
MAQIIVRFGVAFFAGRNCCAMSQCALPAELDTFPKLLARNARHWGDRPAYREKEFGIWQSWTWAEAEAEIAALAAGLAGLGLEPGDHLAIIGRNRPYL